MAHHKRRRPKDARAGCLMCKPHKSNAFKGSLQSQTIQERKARESTLSQMNDILMFDGPGPVGPDGGLVLYWNWEDWEDYKHTWSP